MEDDIEEEDDVEEGAEEDDVEDESEGAGGVSAGWSTPRGEGSWWGAVFGALFRLRELVVAGFPLGTLAEVDPIEK